MITLHSADNSSIASQLAIQQLCSITRQCVRLDYRNLPRKTTLRQISCRGNLLNPGGEKLNARIGIYRDASPKGGRFARFRRPAAIQLWNFPKSANHYLRFKIDTEADDSDKKLQAAKSAWEMGFRLNATDVADIIGMSMATADDKQLFNPQVTASIDQASEASKRPLEERIEENYYKNLGVTAGQ